MVMIFMWALDSPRQLLVKTKTMTGIIDLLNSCPFHLYDHECFTSKELDTAQPLSSGHREPVFEYLV
jgi:hypothetical protein